MNMKTCLLAALVFVAASALPTRNGKAQRSQATDAEPLSANKNLVRGFYTPFTTGNTAGLNDVLAADWQDIPMAPGQAPGRDGLPAIVDQLRETFSGFSAVEQDFIAEGDKVVVRSVWTAVHTGGFFGIKPTGKRITMNTTDVHQVANGRIIRTWHLEDMMGVYAQIGGLESKR